MIVLYVLLGVAAAVILLYVISAAVVSTKKVYDSDSSFYRRLLNIATAAAMKLLRIRVHLSGKEQLPEDKRFLLVSNHRSNYDPIVSWYALKDSHLAFVSKEGNFRIPIFGRIIRRCCFMSIDRENPKKAMKTINHAARLLERGEVSVGVYPEGTRSKSGELLPFHNGVLKIAQKSHAPVVVMSVSGTDRIARNIASLRASDVYLDIIDVIPEECVAEQRSNVLGDRIREELERNLSRRKASVKNKNDLCAV